MRQRVGGGGGAATLGPSVFTLVDLWLGNILWALGSMIGDSYLSKLQS